LAGYVIHLAVAEEYLKKNMKLKENYDEFIKGVIYPDSVTDKSQTHYGKNSSETNLYKFLQEHDVKTSFTKGYFLHKDTGIATISEGYSYSDYIYVKNFDKIAISAEIYPSAQNPRFYFLR